MFDAWSHGESIDRRDSEDMIRSYVFEPDICMTTRLVTGPSMSKPS